MKLQKTTIFGSTVCATATLAILLTLGFTPSIAQEASEEVKFSAPGQLLNSAKSVPALSADGLVVTHLLENCSVSIGGAGVPEAGSLAVTLRSVLGKHEKPVSVKQRLIGRIDIEPGVDAALILQSCGKTTVVSLPKSGKGDVDFNLNGTVPPGEDYLASVYLLVQRGSRDKKVNGMLTLDTLEVAVGKGSTKSKAAAEEKLGAKADGEKASKVEAKTVSKAEPAKKESPKKVEASAETARAKPATESAKVDKPASAATTPKSKASSK